MSPPDNAAAQCCVTMLPAARSVHAGNKREVGSYARASCRRMKGRGREEAREVGRGEKNRNRKLLTLIWVRANHLKPLTHSSHTPDGLLL